MVGVYRFDDKCCICRIRKKYEDEKRRVWGICERCKDMISEDWVL